MQQQSKWSQSILSMLAIATFASVVATRTTPCLAIAPKQWEQTSEADFEQGETDKTLVTNFGDIKLSAQIKKLGKMPSQTDIIFDLQYTPDGVLYLASGPDAKLLQYKEGKIQEVQAFKGQQIFALALTEKGQLLVGISGPTSRLAVLEKNELKDLLLLEKTRYIWDIVVDKQTVYLATGVEGKLLKVNLAPKGDHKEPVVTELLDAAQNNLLCLGKDAQGRLFVGTDGDGLVYRVSFDKDGKPKPYVVYDAAEPEIGTLLLRPDGTLYIGTADAKQARPGRLAAASKKKSGRPIVTPPVTVTPKSPKSKSPKPKSPKPDSTKPTTGKSATDAKPSKKISEPKPNKAKTPAASKDNLTPKDTPQDAADTNKPKPPAKQVKPKVSKAEPKKPKASAPDTKQKPKTPKASVKPKIKPAKQQATNLWPSENKITASIKQASATAKQQATAGLPLDALVEHELRQLLGGNQAVKEAQTQNKEKLDALRQEIRSRLLSARQGGQISAEPTRRSANLSASAGSSLSPAAAPRRRNKHTASKAHKKGNAVYRISPNGFVTEVFRESVMILKLAYIKDHLLVATGNEGQIFRVKPDADETTILAEFKAKQILAMTQSPKGNLIVATTNPATLTTLHTGFATQGTYISDIYDASQISLWGSFHITAKIPKQTGLTLQTRSGNVQDPDKAAWSPWSSPIKIPSNAGKNQLRPFESKTNSSPARFLQYKLTLTSDGTHTPTVDRVAIMSAIPNLKPVISKLQAAYLGQHKKSATPAPTLANAAGPIHQSKLKVTWKAKDPNGDRLQYRLDYRFANAAPWIVLHPKWIKSAYDWNTLRVPDGWYQVRVTATDLLSNPTGTQKISRRISDPILVDNTPPVFIGLKGSKKGPAIIIAGKVHDQLSTIKSVHYAVDSFSDWKLVLPQDQIWDSTTESLIVTIIGLSRGEHIVTLRAIDDRNNAAYKAVIVKH